MPRKYPKFELLDLKDYLLVFKKFGHFKNVLLEIYRLRYVLREIFGCKKVFQLSKVHNETENS